MHQFFHLWEVRVPENPEQQNLLPSYPGCLPPSPPLPHNPKATVHPLDSSLFPFWGALRLWWLTDVHHEQHHQQLPAQCLPTVGSGLSSCKGWRTWYQKCSPACPLCFSCICCWLLWPGISGPPKTPTGSPTRCQGCCTPQCWSRGHDSPPPPVSLSHHQRKWDSPRVKAVSQPLFSDASDAPDAKSQARLLAARRKGSGAWLNALPVPSLGLRMNDETTCVAVGLRLGTPLCRPHECSYCGAKVDNLATHGLS